ncbi:MAG: hypothetical protein ACYDCQ_09040 [Dehalococcoidia bacterium]
MNLPTLLARALLVVTAAAAATIGLSGVAAPQIVRAAQPSGTEPETLLLLRYRLAASDLPEGFSISAETATPNAALAFGAGADLSVPLLQRLVGAGRVTGIQQTLVPDSSAAGAPVSLSLALFKDAGSAAAVAMVTDPPGANGDTEVLPPPDLGDGARAARADLTQTDGSVIRSSVIAWSRGPLFLAVSAAADPASNLSDLVVQIAGIADAHAAATGDVSSEIPSLVLRNDGVQLALAQALDRGQLPLDAAPAGYSRSGRYLYSNDQVILDARAPAIVARQLRDDWRRQVGEVEYFATADSTRSVLSSLTAVFEDSKGASGAMAQLLPSSASQQAVLPLSPAIQLGDETGETRTTLLWPGAELRDAYTLQWRHGRVLLSVIVNLPSGQPAPDFLSNVAAALDGAYLAHQLVGP